MQTAGCGECLEFRQEDSPFTRTECRECARVEDHDPPRRDRQDAVAVKAEEHEHTGDRGQVLAGRLRPDHRLDLLARLEVRNGRIAH